LTSSLQSEANKVYLSSIDTPFNAMVDKINSTTGNFTFNLDAPTQPASTAFVPVAGSDLCSSLDLSFIDGMAAVFLAEDISIDMLTRSSIFRNI
jgi:hypothetical protein